MHMSVSIPHLLTLLGFSGWKNTNFWMKINYLPFNHFTAGVLVSQPAERTSIQTAEEPKHKTRGKNESLQYHHFLSLYKNNLKCPG